MLTQRLLTGILCAVGFAGGATGAWAADADGDGVLDGIDVCCNTPAGVPVDNLGRPVADLDNDCDVDMTDFGIFQLSLTGPMTCGPEVCDGVDNDCNCAIDDVGTLTCGTGACEVTVPACVSGVPQTCTPGTPSAEVCDSIDNDCDGQVDEGVASSTWYQDNDGDGYGDNPSVVACSPPPGYVALSGDCDDSNFMINPSATEICNGVDDDCNGTADDNATGGSPWYADQDGDGYGDPNDQIISCTAPLGYVSNAIDCDDANAMVKPGGVETCNGVDDDCDGTTDDGLGTITCGTGACQNTVPACFNGQPNSCTPGTSSPEICDGNDNDCDGMTDEGLVGCNSNCPGNPQPEVCDGMDNDCDSQVDEGLGVITCGTGACQNSVPACVGGVPQTCTPGNSSPEVCDGADNDCNGMTDDNISCPAIPNASGTCNGVGCAYTCDPGYSDCNSNLADGCETPLNTVQDCGACGSVCPAGPNQVALCMSGSCQTVCNAFYLDCDASTVNGCEVHAWTDPNNCGSCGNVCPAKPNATATCSSGSCGYVCDAGYADCNSNMSDGCEINVDSDVSHCGGCNIVCPTGQSCVAGQCQ